MQPEPDEQQVQDELQAAGVLQVQHAQQVAALEPAQCARQVQDEQRAAAFGRVQDGQQAAVSGRAQDGQQAVADALAAPEPYVPHYVEVASEPHAVPLARSVAVLRPVEAQLHAAAQQQDVSQGAAVSTHYAVESPHYAAVPDELPQEPLQYEGHRLAHPQAAQKQSAPGGHDLRCKTALG